MSGELDFSKAVEEKTTVPLSPENEERYNLITRDLQEVTSGDIIRQVLADGEVPRLYWGRQSSIFGADSRHGSHRTAWVEPCRVALTTAHIAYCVPLMKIADFLSAGVHVGIRQASC